MWSAVLFAGLMSSLTRSDFLSNLLYSSCVKLIHHIESESKILMSSSAATGAGREVGGWVWFQASKPLIGFWSPDNDQIFDQSILIKFVQSMVEISQRMSCVI